MIRGVILRLNDDRNTWLIPLMFALFEEFGSCHARGMISLELFCTAPCRATMASHLNTHREVNDSVIAGIDPGYRAPRFMENFLIRNPIFTS